MNLHQKHPAAPDENAQLQRKTDTWKQEQTALLKKNDKVIAKFESIYKKVEVLRNGTWIKVRKGMEC